MGIEWQQDKIQPLWVFYLRTQKQGYKQMNIIVINVMKGINNIL